MASAAPPSVPPSAPRRWLWPAIAAVAVLVIAIGTVVLTRRADSPSPSASPTGTASTPTPSAPVTTSAGTTTSTSTTGSATTSGPDGTAAVPVYYARDVEGVGPRLYREFHQLPITSSGVVGAAVTRMLLGRPADPDYRTLWPQGIRVASVTNDGSVATVDLTGFVSLGAAAETAAVQQLVYTVTGADPAIRSVRLLVDGAPPRSGHADWSQPVSRADPLSTLANVWIITPGQGATVTSPVTVRVYGTGYEGNIPLAVYRGSTQVTRTFVTTAQGEFAEASTTITLPPGSYELRAGNDSGQDGSLTVWDTKTFQVR